MRSEPASKQSNVGSIVGYYRGNELMYVVRMPFANLPDTHKSRWGDELTAEKMKECVWLRPVAVAQIEFLEWTEADRLRHSKFAGLREDKDPRQVVKEHAGVI